MADVPYQSGATPVSTVTVSYFLKTIKQSIQQTLARRGRCGILIIGSSISWSILYSCNMHAFRQRYCTLHQTFTIPQLLFISSTILSTNLYNTMEISYTTFSCNHAYSMIDPTLFFFNEETNSTFSLPN